jgi:hypothetical protein
MGVQTEQEQMLCFIADTALLMPELSAAMTPASSYNKTAVCC